MIKAKRYIVVGTNKDGNLGAWDDMDSETWTAPWGVYDTQNEIFTVTGFRWKWLARFFASLEKR